MPTCPECESALDFEDEDLQEGQTIDCPECGAELEVVSTDPVELDLLKDDDDEGMDGEEEEAW